MFIYLCLGSFAIVLGNSASKIVFFCQTGITFDNKFARKAQITCVSSQYYKDVQQKVWRFYAQ